MITGIPTVPDRTGDAEKDITALYRYLNQLTQTFVAAPGYASDPSIQQSDGDSNSFGYMMTEPQEPLESFIPGPQGPQGPPGMSGLPGIDAEDTEISLPIPGLQGLQGLPGNQGIPGVDGEDGFDSVIPGPEGKTGIQGIQGPPGVDGDSMDNQEIPVLPYSPIGTGNPWPIGAVFLSVVSTNPATLLGFGVWAAFGTGRVLVGIDAADVDFDTVEETGGAKTIAAVGTVSQPTFAGNALASHSHSADGTLTAANESAHTHSDGSYVTGTPSSTQEVTINPAESV